MLKLTRSILAALVCASCSTAALAKDVTVMISGGFKAALEKLAPEYEAQSGRGAIFREARLRKLKRAFCFNAKCIDRQRYSLAIGASFSSIFTLP